VVGRSRRNVFKIGRSKAITLPKEWIGDSDINEVYVIFDKYLIVTKEKEDAERIVDSVIIKMLKSR